MKRTTVMLPDDVESRLRFEARRRGVAIAEIVREAVEQHLPPTTPAGPLSFFGVGEGDSDNGSEQVEQVVRDVVRKRRRSR